MRAVVQRVRRAEVRVDSEVVSKIGTGLVVLVGVAAGDRKRTRSISRRRSRTYASSPTKRAR